MTETPETPATPLPRLFHGGFPGLRPGELLTPHPPAVHEGCDTCAARAAGLTHIVDGRAIDPPTGRPDRVYVTSDREYARFYAGKWPRGGDLYVIEPVGEVEPSTEDRFPTWAVEAARVKSVYARCVIRTAAQRRALDRRWKELDFAADPEDERQSVLWPHTAAVMQYGAAFGRVRP
ncbi:hypothetical protein [Streptomyces sp. G1]|uniref:hypothetical protein n=1 Tax=Streptomyces sp. G1 TaxID=361572 RepID=UPI00202E30FC|nr:hypothetical protein [Streptomyces sp. G1]MCM1964901.1 hypothetical protein [Streptomyces sp. G1]